MTINLKELGLFWQVRVGQYGEDFLIFKIKTMLSEREVNDDGVASVSKHRITKLGSLLRRTHLDELPQLFSVLYGNMSIIGPRPETKSIMDKLNYEDRRAWIRAKPGLISPATLSFINEEIILEKEEEPLAVYLKEILPKKAEMNRAYSDNINFVNDLRIFINYLRIIIKND